MDRRKAIRDLAIATGSFIMLPQWMISCGISDSTIHQTTFSSTEQKLLSSLTDTIIPGGNGSIGAISEGVDKFLQKLIDDCYEKEVQENVKVQLKYLDESAENTYQHSFTDCSASQREELFLKMSSSENKSEKDFFELIKSETIRGFNTSQKVMQDYLGYKVAPGHYYGCVDVNAKDYAG